MNVLGYGERVSLLSGDSDCEILSSGRGDPSPTVNLFSPPEGTEVKRPKLRELTTDQTTGRGTAKLAATEEISE